ncbi:ABC transporter permease [Rhodococcus koreensis]
MRAYRMPFIQISVFIALLFVWYMLSWSGVVDRFYVSDPLLVLEAFRDLVTTPSTYGHLRITLQEIILGFAIGAAAGVMVGMILGIRPFVYRAISPIFTTFYTMPRLALLPIFVLWFGIGIWSKIALIVSLVFFSMALNTYTGVRRLDLNLIDAVKLMGGGRLDLLREVIFPSILPWLLAGLRISLIFALTGAVVGEMMISEGGLGYLITQRSAVFDTTGVLAILVIVALAAMVFDGFFTLLERRYAFRGMQTDNDSEADNSSKQGGKSEPVAVSSSS